MEHVVYILSRHIHSAHIQLVLFPGTGLSGFVGEVTCLRVQKHVLLLLTVDFRAMQQDNSSSAL